ncbi:Serine/threonine-protein phosphatase 6 regulatory subunit 3 [Halotydeus destructor]|nr:Serine/threonine-protein phosphatase 6 regulatory subunit 3 [Halotydeus destructor]
MFWQFESGAVSQIDNLLDKEDITLTELLEEDDVIQECKSQNLKLMSFLTKPEILDELVTLIITEPGDDTEEKSRYKYANIACELLTSDVPSVNDALVLEKSLLDKLFGYLKTDEPLNPLLASFFSKTVGLLVVRRPSEVCLKYLRERGDFLDLTLKHIETSAIIDLYMKMIAATDEMRNDVVQYLSQSGLVRKLIEFFKEGANSEQQVNSSQLLCDMIKAIRENQALLQDKADADPLLEELEKTETVTDLLEYILGNRTETSLVTGITVLQSLLEYKKHSINIQQHLPANQQNLTDIEFEGVPQCLAPSSVSFKPDGAPEPMSTLDADRLAKGVIQVQSAIIPRLDDFHSILLSPPAKDPVITTVGLIEKPLGASRLEIVHLLRALISSNSLTVNNKIAELKTLPIIINLFFDYPWNNFLHTQIEQSLKLIFGQLRNNSSTAEGQDCNKQLVRDILIDGKLVDRILEAWSIADNCARDKKPRPGYMGHIIKIANIVSEVSDHEIVLSCFEEFEEDVKENWKNFLLNNIETINKRYKTPLVNEVPMKSDLEGSRQDNALHQAFIEYQMQQMTKNLCCQIGFNTSEFSDADEIRIPPQADQLTKVNFSLEVTNNRPTDDDSGVGRRGSLGSNSSDEDFWDDRDTSEKNIMFETHAVQLESSPSQKMEVEADPWTAAFNNEDAQSADTSATPDPWSNPQSAGKSSGSDQWADFGSFESAFSAPPMICVIQPPQSDAVPAESGQGPEGEEVATMADSVPAEHSKQDVDIQDTVVTEKAADQS